MMRRGGDGGRKEEDGRWQTPQQFVPTVPSDPQYITLIP